VSLYRLSIPTQAGEDASQQIEQCANLDKQRLTAEVRALRTLSRIVPFLVTDIPQTAAHMQEEEKAAEKAVTDALLKLGNLVHDSVRIDDNEVRRHELVAVSYTSSTACQRL